MPTVLYLRGCPGTGKKTVADILERDLGWPVLWVHLLDPIYKCIGEYKVPGLTDHLMQAVAAQIMCMASKRNLMIVRPSRDEGSVSLIANTAVHYCYTFLPIRLTASYATLCTRVTRRWHESPFRLTTKEALDEYLNARPEQPFPGEIVIDTDAMTPEQVAGRIKELLH